jgi:sugar lactone lactonase YvrE
VGQATPFASLPASVAAFHLAWGPDDALYVTAPTLSTCDPVYRIDSTGTVDVICTSFGRPQGLAFDRHGSLHVVEALAGVSGLYRLEQNGSVVQVLSAASLVGLSFDPVDDSLVVALRDTTYRVAL